jgi:hypothetical protein
MLRGLGKVQMALLGIIRRHGRPMTFAEMRGGALSASLERSARRALHRLVCDGLLIAMGDGGPGEPLRYFLHPLGIGMMGDTPEAHELRKALEADSGADVAAAMWMVRMAASPTSPSGDAGLSGWWGEKLENNSSAENMGGNGKWNN